MKISFLPLLQMSYSSTYGCGQTEAVHTCHDCPEARLVEFAGARSSGFIKEAYLPTLLANPTVLQTWLDGIEDGSIIVLPQTRGSYDPGDPKELKGYGNRKFSYGQRTMTLTVNDPDYVDNYHFYNEISQRTDLVPFFVTSSQVRIFDTVASIKAKDPIVEDIEEVIDWQVESQVVSVNLPIMVAKQNIASVFTCSNF